MLSRSAGYLLFTDHLRRLGCSQLSLKKPANISQHDKVKKFRKKALNSIPSVLSAGSASHRPHAKAKSKRYTHNESKVDQRVAETDEWDEKYEIMGKRRSKSFVDTQPIIIRGGYGGAGAGGGKGGVGGMGGDVILVGEEQLSLRMFRDLLHDSSLKRAKADDDFTVQDSEYSLSEIEVLSDVPIIEGGRGVACTGKTRWGPHGANVVIKCPINVDIRDVKTGEIIANITKAGQEVLIARGGIGGKGLSGLGIDRRRWNSLQEKHRAQQWIRGHPGDQVKCVFELKRIADVGLIGYPNAGKSTLLRARVALR